MQNEDCRLCSTFVLLLLQIGEIASRYQLHTLLPSRSAWHIRRKFQWTSEQLKSAYLDLQYFHRRSSKCRTSFFVVGMIYSLFILYSSLGQQLSFKRKHHGVVPIHGPWSHISKTSHLKLKREVSRTEKKGSRLRLCFRVVDEFQRRKKWICESRCRQVSVRLHVFAGFFCP